MLWNHRQIDFRLLLPHRITVFKWKKISGMFVQQYSNALQCNYVSLLFVRRAAATLTRAHRSMCQFRAWSDCPPARLPAPLPPAYPPACCQMWQTKEAATSAAATTSFPFLLYSGSPHCQWQVIESVLKADKLASTRFDSTRQFICSYSCNYVALCVFLYFCISVFEFVFECVFVCVCCIFNTLQLL